MNREIKFRAWDINKKVFIPTNVYAVVTTDFNAFAVMLKDWENYKEGEYMYSYSQTLSQYTGLLDKNGKEIYEGDILAYKSSHIKHDGKMFNNVVEFAQGQSLCGWRMRNGKCVVKATPYKFVSSEIIGNLYQTPELL